MPYKPSMEPDEFDTVGFLLGDAARVLRGRFDQYAQAHGITRTQWLVLLTLMRNEGASQASIAELLEVEPITLSRMINRLEAGGLVKRGGDLRDRRVKKLYLTQNARGVLKRLRLMGAKVMAEASKDVAPEDVIRFIAILRQFRANLADAGSKAPDVSKSD